MFITGNNMIRIDLVIHKSSGRRKLGVIAGEILLTSIKYDGTMEGYDIEITKKITEAISIPVIVSGGAGNYEHMLEVLKIKGVEAVAAASIFHLTEQTPLEAKIYLNDNGVNIRI